MKAKLIAAVLLLTISSGTVFSQSFNKAKLDSLLDILATKDKAMGSLTISQNGTVLYSRAIGYSFISPAEKIPSTDKTKYRIGSISKLFTATMILQLVEERKLSLTETVDKYFPTLPNANKITIDNLLHHRSGLHNFTNDPSYQTYMTQPKTHDEMLAIISGTKVDFEPNEKFAYSNSNYVVLGYLIEKISGQSYATFLANRITSKIGLSSTFVGAKTDVKNNESFSYRFMNDWVQAPETDMSIPGGAGALVSTPGDLTKFIEALFASKLVSSASLNQMKTMIDGYGMGLFQIPFGTKKAFGHNGGIDGFQSNLAYFPDDALAIAYCTNGVVYPMNDVLIGVLRIYFNDPYSIPTFKSLPPFDVKTEDLDKYLGIYSSEKIPMKITITKNGATLIAQATGQSSFPLEATEKDKFRFEAAGINMEFNPDKNEFTLKQGGQNIVFSKEK